jgi:hypothetical protein
MRHIVAMAVSAALAVLAVGWCAVTVADAVAQVSRIAAARDAVEARKAGQRQRWRDGTLLKSSTTARKSRAMARVLSTTKK